MTYLKVSGRNVENGTWICCDDQEVKSVNFEDIITELNTAAYIVLYTASAEDHVHETFTLSNCLQEINSK